MSLQGARIIWLTFLCAACGFILVAHLLHRPQGQVIPPPGISWALAAVGAVEIVFFGTFRRSLLARSRNKAQEGDTGRAQAIWAMAQVYGFASALSIVLFGFVLSMVGAPPPWMSAAFFVAGLINIAVYRPQLPNNR
jgi:hypothetical protein